MAGREGESGGLIGAVLAGVAEFAMCSLWISDHTFDYVHTTPSWGQTHVRFLIAKSKPMAKWKIFAPFSLDLWLLLVFAILLQGLSLWAVSRSKSGSLLEAILYTFGQLTLSHPGLSFNTKIGKGLVFSMSIFALVITNLYSGSVVSGLTAPVQAAEINSVREIVEKNIKWGVTAADYDPWYLNFDNKWHREIMKYTFVPTVKQLEALVLDGKVCVKVDYLDPDYIFEDNSLSPKSWNHFHLVKEDINTYQMSIGIQKGSILIPPVDLILNRMKDSGLIQKWKSDIVRKRGVTEVKRLLLPDREGVKVKPLSLSSLQGAFFIIILGWLSAMALFVTEVAIRGPKNVQCFHNKHIHCE